MDEMNPSYSRLAEAMAGADPAARLQMRQRQTMMGNLLRQGGNTAPVQSPWEGISRMAAGALGGYMYGSGMFGLGGGVSPVGGAFDVNAARAMPGGFMPGFNGS